MAEGYRRIYFDKETGNKIAVVAYDGDFIPTTIEQDIATFTALSERNRDTFDVLELAFGEYAQDFAECNGYRVNVETKALEFSYPDPLNPEAPQVFETPLTEQIKILKQDQSQLSSDFQGLTDYLAETGVL